MSIQIMRKFFAVCLFLLVFSLNEAYSLTPISHRVPIKHNAKLNLTVPGTSLSQAGEYRNTMFFRMKSLPEVDKYLDEYLVIPGNGLVIPVVETGKDSNDRKTLIDGNDLDYNKYLKGGAMKFSTETGYGEFGNIVVFGHSSYWKHDNGRYKTHFQKIIELDTNEEVWIFKKLDDGSYKRHIYTTKKQYNTPATNLSVLNNKRNDKKLTLFTCTPIGSLTGRWIVEAYYNEETRRRNLGDENIALISEVLQKIGDHPKMKEIIPKILQQLLVARDRVLDGPTSSKQEARLNMFHVVEEELSKMYRQ